MRRTRVGIVAALLVSAPGSGWAQTQTTPKYETVVALPLDGGHAAVDEAVELRLRELGTLQVFARAEVDDLARIAAQQSQAGCEDDAACLAKLVAGLSSDLVLSGSVREIGGTWTLALSLIDGRRAQVVARASESGPDEASLAALAGRAVDTLLARISGGGDVRRLPLSSLGAAPSFAVMDLEPRGVPEEVARSLTDALVVELSQFAGAKVFSRADMMTMLDLEAQKQALGCDDISCMAEIGDALGVRFIVSGSVNQLAERYFVNVRVIEAGRAQVAGAESEQFRGPADELLIGMRFLVRRLFEVPYAGKGRLVVSVGEPGAALTLDGVARGVTPTLELPPSLEAGRHLIQLEKEGFHPLVREAYVEPARVHTLGLELQPLPTPWWKTWWFWTATSVVVAGAVAGTVAATQLGSEPTSGDGRGTLQLPEGATP